MAHRLAGEAVATKETYAPGCVGTPAAITCPCLSGSSKDASDTDKPRKHATQTTAPPALVPATPRTHLGSNCPQVTQANSVASTVIIYLIVLSLGSSLVAVVNHRSSRIISQMIGCTISWICTCRTKCRAFFIAAVARAVAQAVARAGARVCAHALAYAVASLVVAELVQ